MSYLLDTNVLSEWRKSVPDEGVVNWFTGVRPADLHLSVVTVGEIRRGVTLLRGRNDRSQAASLDAWIRAVKEQLFDRLLPVTVEIAEEWGHSDALRRSSAPGALIAATAKVHNLILVTRNTRHFEHTGVRLLNPFAG